MIAFSVGSFHVYWYGIMYLLSFILWYVLLTVWQKKGWYRFSPTIDHIIKNDLDGVMIAILSWVMIWWRLWHVFIYDFAYFVAHPSKILAFSEWGMSFIGWIVGVVLAIMIYFRINSWSSYIRWKSTLLAFFDAILPIVPLGIFFGRFGNFLNQELYGLIVPEHAWWLPQSIVHILIHSQLFYVYGHVWPELRVNTNFLSMIFEWLLLSALLWVCFFRNVVTKKRNSWQLSAIFLFGYSLVRFGLEYLRQDSQSEFVGFFTKSQWFFVVFMMVAVVMFVVQKKKK